MENLAMSDIRTPASRNADPESSHEAESNTTKSGKRQNQIEEIAAYVSLHPGSTSGEIAAGLGGDYDNVKVSRRLSDMRGLTLKQGDPRKCAAKGSLMVSWFPIGALCLGNWQAKITSAPNDDAIKELINEAPGVFRQQLISHAITVRELRNKAEMEKRRK